MDDLLKLFSRRRRLILVTLVVVLAAGALYSWLTVPVWEATALLRIEEQNIGPTAALFPDLAGKSQLETEMLVVETRPILGRAVDVFGLDLSVLEPKDLPRQLLFSELDLHQDTRGIEYALSRVGPDRYSVEATMEPDSVIQIEVPTDQRVLVPGGAFSIASDSVMKSRGLSSPPEQIRLRTIPFDEAVEELRDALSVTRPNRDASLFRISYHTPDRWLARDVVNEVTAAFIDQGRNFQKAEARNTVAFLQEQSDQIEVQLEEAENAFQHFRERQQVVSIQSEAQEQVRRLAELQTERSALVAERDALANLFLDGNGATDAAPDLSRLVSFRSFREIEAVQTLAQSLIEAETQRTELRAHWTEGHPEVVALDRQIDQLRARLEEIGRNYLRSLNGQIASLDSALVEFGRDLEEIPARELQYARLERQAVLLADLYSVLRQRLKEAEVRAAVEDQNAVVVEPAIMPLEPIHPRPIRYMALAGVLGLMLGLVLAFVRERLDTVFRREDDVGELLGLSVLSQVPRLSTPSGRSAEAGALVAVGRGPSRPAEAFRTLRTSVFFATHKSGGAREILVTSPGAREGKSTTCCNVAITSAQQGLTTLLVDCDLRRGGLHRVFDIPNAPGLSEFLTGRLPPGDLIHPTGISKLFLVTAGSPVQNSSELLGSPQFERFLDSARKSFQVIIVDSPPVMAVTDAILLSTKIGGVILVVRTDRTHRQAAADALARLQTVGAEMLGVVVNDTPGKGRYGYGDSYYYDDLSENLAAQDFAGEKR